MSALLTVSKAGSQSIAMHWHVWAALPPDRACLGSPTPDLRASTSQPVTGHQTRLSAAGLPWLAQPAAAITDLLGLPA
ncbi:hypothetical protein BC831DRAFT_494753, partial [Entophlyctis helioformis]